MALSAGAANTIGAQYVDHVGAPDDVKKMDPLTIAALLMELWKIYQTVCQKKANDPAKTEKLLAKEYRRTHGLGVGHCPEIYRAAYAKFGVKRANQDLAYSTLIGTLAANRKTAVKALTLPA